MKKAALAVAVVGLSLACLWLASLAMREAPAVAYIDGTIAALFCAALAFGLAESVRRDKA